MASPGPIQALDAAQAQRARSALGLLQAGNAAAALEIARALAAAAPRAPDAQQLLAMCAADAGQAPESERAFRAALALAPDQPVILLNFAASLRKSRRHDEAIALLRRATQVAPALAKPWIELGAAALDAGNPMLAREALLRGVQLQPDAAAAWHALGNAHRALDEIDAAEAALQRAVALAPGSAPARIGLGVVQRLLGRPEAAIGSLQQAASAGYAGPELADALTGALLDAGRLGEALRQARELVRTRPDFVPGQVTLANLLWEYGPVVAPGEDAVATLRQAVQARPDDADLRLAFVGFLLTARQPDEALAAVQALRARADAPMLVALEADARQMQGDLEAAGALYAQAHRGFGDTDAAFLNAYARYLFAARQPGLAADRASEALRRYPDDQEAWANLGTAWRLLGDRREAWLCDYERLVGVVPVEPPPGHADVDTFLAALRAVLEPLHQAGREPLRQSLRGGSQTSGRLFGRGDPAIAAAQQALQDAAQRWLATLPEDASHPFLRRNTRAIRFSGSWSVRLWSSGRHVNHIHPEGWMSSAFYVALPPSIGADRGDGGNAGYLQFGQPPAELGVELPPRRTVRPVPGQLALFPSYFWHGTVPFEDTHPRLTIAFDMLPTTGAPART
jgi:tetratricopeptide (TPR) repeat protein